MRMCWAVEPRRRPTATTLAAQVRKWSKARVTPITICPMPPRQLRDIVVALDIPPQAPWRDLGKLGATMAGDGDRRVRMGRETGSLSPSYEIPVFLPECLRKCRRSAWQARINEEGPA